MIVLFYIISISAVLFFIYKALTADDTKPLFCRKSGVS